MNGSLAIFGPMFGLGLWTFVVLNVLGVSRVRAVSRHQVRPDDFRFGASESVPQHVRIANRNYMNLLELPVLFYAIAITVFVTETVSSAMVATAWLFAALRVGHSVVHLTTNNV